MNNKFRLLKGHFKSQFLAELDLSIANYEAILKKDPRDKETWMNLGRAYHKKFQFEKAIESKLKAREISPSDPEVNFSLGCSFCAKGDSLAAIESYLEALKYKPDYADACDALAEQYQIIGAFGKADKWFGKAAEIRFRQAETKS